MERLVRAIRIPFACQAVAFMAAHDVAHIAVDKLDNVLPEVRWKWGGAFANAPAKLFTPFPFASFLLAPYLGELSAGEARRFCFYHF